MSGTLSCILEVPFFLPFVHAQDIPKHIYVLRIYGHMLHNCLWSLELNIPWLTGNAGQTSGQIVVSLVYCARSNLDSFWHGTLRDLRAPVRAIFWHFYMLPESIWAFSPAAPAFVSRHGFCQDPVFGIIFEVPLRRLWELLGALAALVRVLSTP